jgi:hypothetical protein
MGQHLLARGSRPYPLGDRGELRSRLARAGLRQKANAVTAAWLCSQKNVPTAIAISKTARITSRKTVRGDTPFRLVLMICLPT